MGGRLKFQSPTLLVAPLYAWMMIGCEDQSYREIGGEIRVLSRRDTDVSAIAQARLVRFGRHAIPQIETALHTAPETGRLHLIATLTTIGHEDVVPILRHFALYDSSDTVREACDQTLRAWVEADHTSDRAEKARAAQTFIRERRAQGEGPAPSLPSAIIRP